MINFNFDKAVRYDHNLIYVFETKSLIIKRSFTPHPTEGRRRAYRKESGVVPPGGGGGGGGPTGVPRSTNARGVPSSWAAMAITVITLEQVARNSWVWSSESVAVITPHMSTIRLDLRSPIVVVHGVHGVNGVNGLRRSSL